ncbi:MAG: hypothetical protein EOP83_14670, partial [Verrucomicrobiaceae bacterium]
MHPEPVAYELAIIMAIFEGAHEHPTLASDLCSLLDAEIGHFVRDLFSKRSGLGEKAFSQAARK